ncbi:MULTISPECIES: hypothetical protein [Butyricimonas]|uniref:hypothetical protein n=1 Tax=Butyricimonas TaxID=574697 RepID=UPI0022E09F46|nr:hypothetical protein [Butyricimonas paravirosa]
MRIKCIFLCFMMIFFACETGKRTQYKVFERWIGKTIIVSNTLEAQVMGRDTVCPELFHQKYKVFKYVDSTGCCECKLQLRSWGKFIDAHKKYQDSVAFILVVHAENPRIVPILCEQNDFKQPIFMDKRGRMNKLNSFSGNIDGWVCLLNEDNRILAVGDPIHESNDMVKFHELMGLTD